jgi:hypothetical protein
MFNRIMDEILQGRVKHHFPRKQVLQGGPAFDPVAAATTATKFKAHETLY